MNYYKNKAAWLPNKKKFVKQLLVSLISYLTIPFFQPKNDGVRTFFKNNYSYDPDDLIFDGTSSGYFDRILNLINSSKLENCTLLDLGCGQGSLLNWLNTNLIKYEQYIGIDFAIEQREWTRVQYISSDFRTVGNHISVSEGKNIVFMCNSLCYIDDSVFNSILSSLNKGDGVIVIDPSPGLFWDAHFSGVKPIYRNMKKVCGLLNDSGFEVVNAQQDFLFKVKYLYIWGLSYGIYAVKG